MMTYIIMGIIIAVFGLVAFFTIKSNIELKKDLADEKDRSQQFRSAMNEGVELSKKARIIDIAIEEKKNARKKMSKKDKIDNANNRSSLSN